MEARKSGRKPLRVSGWDMPLTLRTYVTLVWLKGTFSEWANSFRFSSYLNDAGIPVGPVRERSGDRPDGLSGSSGVVPAAPAVGAVRDSCKRSAGWELA